MRWITQVCTFALLQLASIAPGRPLNAGIRNGIKCQPPTAAGGRFPKDQFAVDLDAKTVTCPAGVTAPIRPSGRDRHAGEAS